MTIGNRASGQVRLAELVRAGVSSRPGGLRESAIAWVCATPNGPARGEWETWNEPALTKALMRLVEAGMIDMTEEDGGRRWHLRPPSDKTRAWARAERRAGRRMSDRIVRAA